MSPAVVDEQYLLVAEKRGYVTDGRGKFVYDAERAAKLPDVPRGFTRMVGSHREVATEAARMNKTQLDGKFLDYLFSPDPLLSPRAPKTKEFDA